MKLRKKITSWFSKTFNYLGRAIMDMLHFLKPDPGVWEGAGWGTAVMVIILVLIAAASMAGLLGIHIISLYVLNLLLIAIAASLAIHLGLQIIRHIPLFYRLILFASVIVLLNYWSGSTTTMVLMIAASILVGTILGGVFRVLQKNNWRLMPIGKKLLNIIMILAGAGGLVFGFFWIFWEGPKTDPPEIAALKTEYRPEHIQLQDPSLPGEYSVLTLTYGSGRDKHREEFREDVTIVTDSVDGSRFVGNWEKFHGWARTRYWGFDEESLPLNARVWYPGGKGPFPLVLIVHGNHLDRDYSDPGYEYLGDLMASRGFIFASVDENFLNSTWSNIWDNLDEENDCRAWLLLKHLELWKEWNSDQKNPFYGKIDLDRISLIGHSRGGEAVAIAACFNQLPVYPDGADMEFDFGFNIRSVIAIAPVDGQYRPANTGTFFKDVSYFTIQGANDMDMQSFHGARQFQRIQFTDDNYHVKAGLYVFGANHGQFNSIWGRNDMGFPNIALYNKRQLITGEDQARIGKVFISAFLEATLLDKREYFDLFRDYRYGMEWLPETVYLNQFEDSECEFIATFEEDIDLYTATSEAWKIQSENLTVWKEMSVPLKWSSQATRAIYAGWNLEETDSVPGVITLVKVKEDSLITDTAAYLYFVIADAKGDSNPHPKRDENEEENGEKTNENIAENDNYIEQAY